MPSGGHLLLRLVLPAALLAGLVHASPVPAGAADVVEQQAALPVVIDGRDERLEALVVRPAAPGRYPVALIVNGASADPRSSHAAWIAHIAHDFAHREWLAAIVVWRGFGTSTGTNQDDAGTCTAPDPARYIDAHVADLAAALVALRARPNVDPATTLGLGISIGGVSMLDLAAQPDHPLRAVINISGGLWHGARPFALDPACGPFEDELVRTVGALGRAAVPTLWLYASNDGWFQPQMVKRMASAYRQGGGTVDLDMLAPFGTDGHTLFLWEANVLIQPLIDRFLRANRLPALDDGEAFAPVLATLEPDERQVLDYYLHMPTEKALAVSLDGRGGLYFAWARRSVDDARQRAMERCYAFSRTACGVVAENTALTGR